MHIKPPKKNTVGKVMYARRRLAQCVVFECCISHCNVISKHSIANTFTFTFCTTHKQSNMSIIILQSNQLISWSPH